ncbi:hypothetical protein CHUAL_002002 [Chamberlinius hualienensis]
MSDEDDEVGNAVLRKRQSLQHLNTDQLWRVINLGQCTPVDRTLGDSGWVNGSVVSSGRPLGPPPPVLHGSFTVTTPLRDALCGSMPNVIYSSRTSVSCLELRDLNAPALQEYLFFYQNRIGPPSGLPQPQLPSQHHNHHHQHRRNVPNHHNQRTPRLSQILECNSKNLSKYHMASLAKAARQISSRDSDRPLSKKAKWLIIVIGIIMFGMSMLLVGITLRLAPMIDEIVRKEHEDLIRKMNLGILGYHLNSTKSVNTTSSSNNSSSTSDIGSGIGNSGLLFEEETESYQIDDQTYSTRTSWSP